MNHMLRVSSALLAGLSVPLIAGVLAASPATKGWFSPGWNIVAVLSGAVLAVPWLLCLSAVLGSLGWFTGDRVRRRSLDNPRLKMVRYAGPAVIFMVAAAALFAPHLPARPSARNPAAHCSLLDIAGAMATGHGCEDSRPRDPFAGQRAALFAAGILMAVFGIGFAIGSLRTAAQ